MFIFNLIFGLIGTAVGLVFALILLPLRLIGLPIAMILLPFKMILRFIARHTLWAVLIIGGIFLIFYFKNNNEKLPQLTPAPQQQRSQKGVPVVEPVLKVEDGDSNFATDLYATMTDAERIEYSRNFYFAMASTPDGQVHNWAHFNINGSIRPNSTFKNNSGVTCRTFSEGLKVHTVQQTITGTACLQGGGSWCKLKPNATPACGLSGNEGFFNSLGRSLGNLF